MERDGGVGGVDRKVFSGGDASIFSSADGLQRLAKTRSGSRQSSRAGSEKSGRGSRGDPPRPDHSAQVNFYGAQARISGGGAYSVSEGSGSHRGGDRRSQGAGSNRAPSTGRGESTGRHGQGAWVRVEDVADHAAPTDPRRARVPSRAASDRSDDRHADGQTGADDPTHAGEPQRAAQAPGARRRAEGVPGTRAGADGGGGAANDKARLADSSGSENGPPEREQRRNGRGRERSGRSDASNSRPASLERAAIAPAARPPSRRRRRRHRRSLEMIATEGGRRAGAPPAGGHRARGGATPRVSAATTSPE